MSVCQGLYQCLTKQRKPPHPVERMYEWGDEKERKEMSELHSILEGARGQAKAGRYKGIWGDCRACDLKQGDQQRAHCKVCGKTSGRDAVSHESGGAGGGGWVGVGFQVDGIAVQRPRGRSVTAHFKDRPGGQRGEMRRKACERKTEE